MHQSICKIVACCDVPLPAGHKYVAVQLLTGEMLNFIIDAKSCGQELFDLACEAVKLNDAKLFGLAIFIDEEFHFLDLQLKLSKHLPKMWKSSNENGLSEMGIQEFVFYLRVQFYVDCHQLLRERSVRHYYYLQLRENVIAYRQVLSVEKAFLLAALALQADFGNYNSQKLCSNYFDPKKYFPLKIISQVGLEYIEEHTPSLHKDYFGLNRGEAHGLYMKESSEEASPHNLHLYKINRKKTKDISFLWLGISFKGIQFYEESKSFTKRCISQFLWSDISRLFHDKKKFGIRFDRSPKPWTLTYYTTSDGLAKSLLWLCKATHQFQMFIEPQIQEIRRHLLLSQKQYREVYVYSNSLDLALEKEQGISNSYNYSPKHISEFEKGRTSERAKSASIISATSSNTTSGIVSDKNQSNDENGDVALAINRNDFCYKTSESQKVKEYSMLQNDDKRFVQCSDFLSCSFKKNSACSKCSSACYQVNGNCLSHLASQELQIARSKVYKSSCECQVKCFKSETAENLQITSLETRYCDNCSFKSSKHLRNVPLEMNNFLHPKTFVHHHIQNTTKIGVSSLTRLRGLQSLHFGDTIFSASSEPSLLGCSASCSSHEKHFALELSSLPLLPGTGEQKNRSKDFESMQSKILPLDTSAFKPEVCTSFDKFTNINAAFSCIDKRFTALPSLTSSLLEWSRNSSCQNTNVQRLGSLPVLPFCNGDHHSNICTDSFSNSLDFHQLRQRNNNVNFPFVPSTCNDRSLLMMPKTVPTCSRRRHIGKDVQHFSCSATLFPDLKNEKI